MQSLPDGVRGQAIAVVMARLGDERAITFLYDIGTAIAAKLAFAQADNCEEREEYLDVVRLSNEKALAHYCLRSDKSKAKFSTLVFQIMQNKIRDVMRSRHSRKLTIAPLDVSDMHELAGRVHPDSHLADEVEFRVLLDSMDEVTRNVAISMAEGATRRELSQEFGWNDTRRSIRILKEVLGNRLM